MENNFQKVILIKDLNTSMVHIFTPQFVDKENGEWYGYLSQQGDISLDFKGGPFKGKI